MNGQICKCGKYEVGYISIVKNCHKNKRFSCLTCKTDNYINQETFIKIFEKNAKELIEGRYQQILYIFNQFKKRQELQLSNDQKDEFYGFFEGMLKQQERLNQIQDITFQELCNKIRDQNDFLNLSEKEIQFILMIRYLSHDNQQQLAQILYLLQNIQQLQSSSLLINLRLMVQKSNIMVFNKKFTPTKSRISSELIYAEDDLICWTRCEYHTLQKLQMQKINDNSSYKEINVTGKIKDILIIMNLIYMSVLLANSKLYQFIEFSREKNQKKQQQFFFKAYLEEYCDFKIVSKHKFILNQYDKGRIILFCLRNKKIINIIKKKSKMFNYISNIFVVIENIQLNFYSLNTKKLKNKIDLQLLEGRCEYLPSKCELITCTNRLVVQKINYQKQSCCILKSFDNVLSYVQNKQHNYLIIFTYDNEIIIYDKNYVLIKRIKWQKFQFSSNPQFIVTKDMKYIYLKSSYLEQKNQLKIYRCQITQ